MDIACDSDQWRSQRGTGKTKKTSPVFTCGAKSRFVETLVPSSIAYPRKYKKTIIRLKEEQATFIECDEILYGKLEIDREKRAADRAIGTVVEKSKKKRERVEDGSWHNEEEEEEEEETSEDGRGRREKIPARERARRKSRRWRVGGRRG